MPLEPIPETVETVEEFGPFTAGDDDLLVQLDRRAAQVKSLVPECVGLSLASVKDGVTFTLVATAEEIAAMDAMQYLSGGPCVEAVQTDEVLACDAELFDEKEWHRFAVATAAVGIASTLSLPVLCDSRVIGTVNLYAATPGAFDGHHVEVADVFGAWAPGATVNADLTFSTRRLAESAPQQLRDDIDVQVATSLVADQDRVDLTEARARLDAAARRAGLDVARLARMIRHVGNLPEGG